MLSSQTPLFAAGDSLFVAQALQKVKIDVNESGTEASSATGGCLRLGAGCPSLLWFCGQTGTCFMPAPLPPP